MSGVQSLSRTEFFTNISVPIDKLFCKVSYTKKVTVIEPQERLRSDIMWLLLSFRETGNRKEYPGCFDFALIFIRERVLITSVLFFFANFFFFHAIIFYLEENIQKKIRVISWRHQNLWNRDKLFWRMKQSPGFCHTRKNCTKIMNQAKRNTEI